MENTFLNLNNSGGLNNRGGLFSEVLNIFNFHEKSWFGEILAKFNNRGVSNKAVVVVFFHEN